MTGRASTDELTRATVTIVWVILANKPFYPLYVWWLIGDGVAMSAVTLLSIPFFVAILLTARRCALAARCLLPMIGAIDTVFETAIFGQPSATLLFLAPCATLAALSFHTDERWWQRAVVCFVFACFAAGWFLIDAPAYPWTDSQIATLRTINIFAVGTLMAFIGLRYAGISRGDGPNMP